MVALGSALPQFELPDVVSGKVIHSAEFKNKPGLLVMFICRHCPYVVHVQDELARLGREYVPKGIGMIAISSNDIDRYPNDRPEQLQAMARELGFIFPFCFDESQKVAKTFTAACTPDFFLYDQERRLVYRGQLDDSRPGNQIQVTGRDLRAAIDALLAGRSIDQNQRPSAGCNIKWKPGNNPGYA